MTFGALFQFTRVIVFGLFCSQTIHVGIAQQIAKSSAAELPRTFKVKHGAVNLLPVNFENRDAVFALDTGTSTHLFDDRFREKLTPKNSSAGVNTPSGRIITDAYHPPEAMFIENLPIRSGGLCLCSDLGDISSAVGIDLEGILGIPFFEGYIVQLNANEEEVIVFNVDTSPLESWGHEFRLIRDDKGICFVDAFAGEELCTFAIDTGCNGAITLAEPVFRRLVNSGEICQSLELEVSTLNGVFTRPSGVLQNFRLGPFEHRDLMVWSSGSSRIGLEYLSRYIATLDVSNQRLYLKPGIGYDRVDEENKSGMTLSWENNQVIVQKVDRGGPADAAGIRPGDLLLEVNGQKALGENMWLLRQELRKKAGEAISVVILRDSAKMECQIVLNEFIDW